MFVCGPQAQELARREAATPDLAATTAAKAPPPPPTLRHRPKKSKADSKEEVVTEVNEGGTSRAPCSPLAASLWGRLRA